MESDAALVLRASRGEASALEELYRRYAPQLNGLLLRMLGSREEAEEILQDTFVQLYREAGRYSPERGAVSTFVFTLGRNLALSRLRMRRARPQKDEERDLHDPEQEIGLWSEDDPTTRILVHRALECLEKDDRLLLEESFFWGYSHTELAERHHMPLGTIKTKVRRALLRLRAVLNDPSEVSDAGSGS